MKIKVYSKEKLSEAIGILRSEWKEHRYLTITINAGKKRTLSQNALSHVWYQQVSDELQEYSAEGVKCLCKLHFGLPIVRADNDDYNELCTMVIDPLSYEAKIRAMEQYPVTSAMTSKQLSKYLEQVQRNHAGRVDLQYE